MTQLKLNRREIKERSVNGHTVVREQMKHDTIDALAEGMRLFRRLLGVEPGLWKADIDSAFRRIPVRKEHRWACAVAFVLGGQASCR